MGIKNFKDAFILSFERCINTNRLCPIAILLLVISVSKSLGGGRGRLCNKLNRFGKKCRC